MPVYFRFPRPASVRNSRVTLSRGTRTCPHSTSQRSAASSLEREFDCCPRLCGSRSYRFSVALHRNLAHTFGLPGKFSTSCSSRRTCPSTSRRCSTSPASTWRTLAWAAWIPASASTAARSVCVSYVGGVYVCMSVSVCVRAHVCGPEGAFTSGSLLHGVWPRACVPEGIRVVSVGRCVAVCADDSPPKARRGRACLKCGGEAKLPRCALGDVFDSLQLPIH